VSDEVFERCPECKDAMVNVEVGPLCSYCRLKATMAERDEMKDEVDRLEEACYEALGDILSGKPRIGVLCHALKYNPFDPYEDGDGWYFDGDEDTTDYLKGTTMMWHPWKREKDEALKAQKEGK
jgi:hypothetical protein